MALNYLYAYKIHNNKSHMATFIIIIWGVCPFCNFTNMSTMNWYCVKNSRKRKTMAAYDMNYDMKVGK